MTSSGRIVRPIKQERIDDEVVAEGSVNNNRVGWNGIYGKSLRKRKPILFRFLQRDTTDAEFRKSIQSPALRHLKLHNGDKSNISLYSTF